MRWLIVIAVLLGFSDFKPKQDLPHRSYDSARSRVKNLRQDHFFPAGLARNLASGDTVLIESGSQAPYSIQIGPPGIVLESAAGLIPVSAFQDGQGRLIARVASREDVLVFDSLGRPLSTLGDFAENWQVTGVKRVAGGIADTLVVISEEDRLDLFGPKLRFHRSLAPGIALNGYLPIGPGRHLLYGLSRQASRFGHPLHILDELEGSLRSFGRWDGGATALTEEMSWMRHIMVDGTSIYAGKRGAYEIERFDLAGTRTSVFMRDLPWFPPVHSADRTQHPPTPPDPEIIRMQLDGSGHLWVVIQVAEEGWTIPSSLEEDEMLVSSSQISENFDWVVEVLDLPEGQLLASQRFDDRVLLGLVGEGLGYRHGSHSGEPTVELVPIRLSRNTLNH